MANEHGGYEKSPLSAKQEAAARSFGHLRDLDRHHPKGWPSLRIPHESYTRSLNPSMTSRASIFGSSSAMCAEATTR